jgi:hypothetical protein
MGRMSSWSSRIGTSLYKVECWSATNLTESWGRELPESCFGGSAVRYHAWLHKGLKYEACVKIRATHSHYLMGSHIILNKNIHTYDFICCCSLFSNSRGLLLTVARCKQISYFFSDLDYYSLSSNIL